MRPGCGFILLISLFLTPVLALTSCESMGYRVKWRGFGSDEDSSAEDADTEGNPISLFASTPVERTAELAWVHWESQHRDLSNALSRNPKSRAYGPHYARCDEALTHIEREQPELSARLEEARQRYRRLQERASDSTPQWIRVQLRQIEKLLEG